MIREREYIGVIECRSCATPSDGVDDVAHSGRSHRHHGRHHGLLLVTCWRTMTVLLLLLVLLLRLLGLPVL